MQHSANFVETVSWIDTGALRLRRQVRSGDGGGVRPASRRQGSVVT